MLIMAMTATLILGTFAMASNAEGVFIEIYEGITIKTNTGTAICTTPEGESCGVGTAKARFQQLVTNVNENGDATGIARGEIRIIPDNAEQISLENVGPITFQYDGLNRVLKMVGEFEDTDGVRYEYDSLGNIIDQKDNKAKIDFIDFIIKPVDKSSGFKVEGLKGIAIVDPADGYVVGDRIKIESKGPATCERANGEDCGPAKMKSKVLLQVEESDGTSASGIGKAKIMLKLGGQEGEEFKSADNPGNPNAQVIVWDWQDGGFMNISGPVINVDTGAIWDYRMKITDINFEDNSGICSGEIANSIGDKIAQLEVDCRLVLLPVDS